MKKIHFALAALIGLTNAVLAKEPSPPDKSHYSLFSPTPDDLLRDFDTDRPDKTNSAHTLDAGHLQLEMDFLAYTRNHDAGIRSENFTWANSNLRLGLTNWADIQFLVPFYQVNRDKDAGKTERASGIGDLSIAFKANFWGNDDGDSSAGIEFILKTPTASHSLGNGKVEGGAFLLYGTKLPGDFDLGFNTGVAINANDSGSGHHADLINSVSISRNLVGPLSAYVEFFTDIDTKHSSDWIGTVDVGFTLMLGKNVQLDTGLNIGVTHAADDLQTFVGISMRF